MFETNDCFTGQIRSEADLVTEIDFSRVNGATGPVAVRGAEPGDSLVAEILDIRTEARGFATLIPEMGQLHERVRAPLTVVFDVDGDTIRMTEHISFPLWPMLGVIGVATDGEVLGNGYAGRHGGNLDNHLHGPGAHLPPRPTAGRALRHRRHARVDGRTASLLHRRRDRRRGDDQVRSAQGQAVDLAGDGVAGPLGRARNGRPGLHGGARPRR